MRCYFRHGIYSTQKSGRIGSVLNLLSWRVVRNMGCQRLQPNPQRYYWIEVLHLYLGVELGERSQRSGYWLRWWDAQGHLLLWGTERLALAQQKVDQERQRADRLAEQLRALGIEPVV